ncbi:MAG: DUF5455 family protein [Aliivibrio sp.]|uniref:DUF5455 family protein n=1 Tax=Aliivibrio sp. TaxID=1872443 RepID=UPI001A47A97E|nr:DUF5455 family protein [Aliivibrio sp.]
MPVFLLPLFSTIANVARLPALAAFFTTLAANLVAWFTRFMSRGAAFNLVVVSLIVGLALTATAAINTMAFGLSFVLPDELVRGISMIMPTNAVPCVSAVFSAKLVRWVWEWQLVALAFKA